MAFVVTSLCDGCKYADCVTVCPADCFHEGETMLYINPETCTECGACEPECPVAAIFHEDSVPDECQEFIQINEEMAAKLPSIVTKKPPLAQ
ncbi:ferredoxin family protein [Bremerella sp. P1]|uniref:ferredoxin family protein n=1 Tax=Bremerella sp. P1 TaxID=3026424 RepID=UPI00236773BA|nr:ferredoxin family protein [Bremerella sp. P1]WDI44823.1 ferredoxin family protein [Bremerella sp. P1]